MDTVVRGHCLRAGQQMTTSEAEHLYSVTDDILLSYHGSKDPLIGVFACEDIATHVAQVYSVNYDSAVAATVRAVSYRGLNLSYSETCDMVDDIVQRLKSMKETGSWLKRNTRALKIKA